MLKDPEIQPAQPSYRPTTGRWLGFGFFGIVLDADQDIEVYPKYPGLFE